MRSRPLEILLSIAATALVLAFFASVPHWPASWTARDTTLPLGITAPLLRGPSVLTNLRPVPTLNLTFPDDVASVVRRSGINGETGLIPTAAAITTFRLNESGDMVSVSSLPDGAGVSAGTHDTGLRVHGQVAFASVDRGIAHVRWTENGVTYDVASRTLLDVTRLTEVANKLR